MPARDTLPKAYVATPAGQVHLRDTGGSGPALLLVHMTPLSGRMWAPVMPLVAQAGWRTLAPDLPGYGRSDPRPAQWSLRQWGETLGQLLDALGIGRAAVLGAHVGAAVALELALARPGQVRALVLDGLPLPRPELAAAFAALAGAPRPTDPAAPVRAAQALMAEYVPGWEAGPGTIEALWPVMLDYLEADFVSSAPLMADWDGAARLPAWRGPLLLTGAERESMAWALEAAAALAPGARSHRWPGTHPVHDPARAAEWAAPILSFLETTS